MNKRILQKIIRLILTTILIYKVYQETGLFTAIAITLISISIELTTQYMALNNKCIESIKSLLTPPK